MMTEQNNNINLYCPIGLTKSGVYNIILSDTTIDRDGEFMAPELIRRWASTENFSIPMLLNHENKVESLVGNMVNPQILASGDDIALSLEPKWFLSNPKAQMVKDMIDKDGAKIGVSIGAIPYKSEEVEKAGAKRKQWTEAEPLEGTIVPVQSNRNSFISLAKKFNLEGIKMTDETIKAADAPVETKVDEIVDKKEVPAEEIKPEAKEPVVDVPAEDKKEPVVSDKPEETEGEKSAKKISQKEVEEQRKSDMAGFAEQAPLNKVHGSQPKDIFESHLMKMGIKTENKWRE